MRVLTFAAGMAAGYVLGTRAGRERYDQIVQSVRTWSGSPTVVRAQEKAKNLVEAGTDAAAAKLRSVSTVDSPPASRA